MTATTFLRLPEVEKRTGLKRSSIYDRIRRGAFPAPVQLAPAAGKRPAPVGWIEAEIELWARQQIEATRARQ